MWKNFYSNVPEVLGELQQSRKNFGIKSYNSIAIFNGIFNKT